VAPFQGADLKRLFLKLGDSHGGKQRRWVFDSMGRPLFLNKDGRGCRSMSEALTTACRKAGVPRITHHSLRHAYATLARGKGRKIEDLSKVLGRANPTVTQNIDVTVFDPALKDAAENSSISPERKSVN
jgi:integrase